MIGSSRRPPLSRRLRIAAKLLVTATAIGILDLVLYYLGAEYQIYVPPFRWIYDWGAQFGLDHVFTASNVVLLLEVVWSLFLVAGGVSLARRRRQEKAHGPDLDSIDQSLEDLAKPRTTPRDAAEMNEDDIERLVLRWRERKRKTWYVIRAIALCFMVVVVWEVVTNLGLVITVILSMLIYLQVFVVLHQRFLPLMLEIYGSIAAAGVIIWAIPYRMSRKKLYVVQEGRKAYLGRTVFIRGADASGNPIPGTVYSFWYGLHRIGAALHGNVRHFEDVAPSAHEVPFGDPFYLNGNKDSRHQEDHFRYEIIYQSATDGWLERRLHTRKIYTNSNVEAAAWQVVLIGDGANLLEVPRKGYDSAAHQELSKQDLTEYKRQSAPYEQRMLGIMASSSTYVDHAVRSDPEGAKEAVRRFVFPSPELILGGAPRIPLDEKPKRKEK